MDSNFHPHMEDMDVEPFGDPDSASIAGLDFEGFNMQTGYAGLLGLFQGDGFAEMQLFGLQTQEAIKRMRAGDPLPSASPVEFRHRSIPPSCLTEDTEAFNLRRQPEEGIKQTRPDGVGFLRSSVSTQLHIPAFAVFDALHALNSQKLFKEDRGPTTESSHVGPPVIPLDNDVPTTVHDPPFSDFERNGKTRYRCNTCNAETARKPDMRRHQKYARCHCPLPQFRCHCGKKYGREDSLKKHEKEYHKRC